MARAIIRIFGETLSRLETLLRFRGREEFIFVWEKSVSACSSFHPTKVKNFADEIKFKTVFHDAIY